jgi:hypothetical protein
MKSGLVEEQVLLPAASGSCLRATGAPVALQMQRVTSSRDFPVAAPQTRVCRAPLRQGPARRHPFASSNSGVARILTPIYGGEG